LGLGGVLGFRRRLQVLRRLSLRFGGLEAGFFARFGGEKREGGGVYIGVEDLGEGLGHRAMSVQSDGIGELLDRAGLCETKTMADRWAMSVSGRARQRGYRFRVDSRWVVG
jgi:hypothetical protein